MKTGKIIRLVSSVLICLAAAAMGSVFTTPSIPTWYALIQKPAFNPPNWVFGPVWTALFILMGISAYLVWEKGLKERKVKVALSVFGVQLVLNILWSALFFGLQSPFYAFIEIIILWIAIVLTIIKFYPVSRNAGLLLIPYIAWVSFAAFLNLSVWLLNA